MLYSGEDEGARDGYTTFLKYVQFSGKQLCESLKIDLLADDIILRECYEFACDFITFHGKTNKANHLKQAAHCCFWIAKLKPIQMPVPLHEYLSLLKRFTPILKRSYMQIANRSQISTYPYNEHLAFDVAHRIIMTGYEDMANEFLNAGNKRDYDSLISAMAGFEDRPPAAAANVVDSLRSNNYSARSMAMMFELAYSTGFE